jgi:hypothetical protein
MEQLYKTTEEESALALVREELELEYRPIEPDNEDEEINDPFDPEEISIDTKTVPMETCLRRLQQGTIKLNPDFQRAEVWTPEKKSQLIESLMLRIPLPMFYVSADEKNNYTVVDGLQRLSTIRSFVLGDQYLGERREELKGLGFRLQNLEFWKRYEGATFNELPENLKNRIVEAEFQFTVINPGTPEEVRRNIFKRLNTGGEPLSSQEIRNALYIGPSTELLKRLAASAAFTRATGGSIKTRRMEDKELILRFLGFLVRSYEGYKTTNVDTYLSDTMIIINAMPTFDSREFKKMTAKGKVNISDVRVQEIGQLEHAFELGMQRSEQLFEQHTFRKSYGINNRKPINKSLFESWGNLLLGLSAAAFEKLMTNKKAMIEDYIQLLNDNEFHNDISRDSMKQASVARRFSKVLNLINTYSV